MAVRDHVEASFEMPVRWVVGSIVAGFAASLGAIAGVVALYERHVGPLRPSEAFRPPAQPPRATERTPTPRSIP